MNELKLVLLLVCVDFPFSFGIQHMLGCWFGLPTGVISGITLALTIIVNLCISIMKFN